MVASSSWCPTASRATSTLRVLSRGIFHEWLIRNIRPFFYSDTITDFDTYVPLLAQDDSCMSLECLILTKSRRFRSARPPASAISLAISFIAPAISLIAIAFMLNLQLELATMMITDQLNIWTKRHNREIEHFRLTSFSYVSLLPVC